MTRKAVLRVIERIIKQVKKFKSRMSWKSNSATLAISLLIVFAIAKLLARL